MEKNDPILKTESEKLIPTFLRPDYPYQANKEEIIDLYRLEPKSVYEIKCHQCEMSIRSQGENIYSIYERLESTGCVGCGNKALVVRKVDMSMTHSNSSD